MMVVSFRTLNTVNKFSEKTAKKQGLTKSEFLAMNALDSALSFEKTRHMDTLVDFISILQPYLITLGIDEETTSKALAKIMDSYCRERLSPHMKLQRHLTDIAIRSYLQDYTEEFEGKEGFIINQCIVSIYDQLLENNLIDKAEWEEKTNFYNLYMQETTLHKKE